MENNQTAFSRITIDSYEGPEPYLFVSYSHRDAKIVNDVLKKIDKEKFRIWYDDTMEIGDDFREELRSKIEHCCAVLLFISNSSMGSKYCGMEIIAAYKYDKRIYPIYLEDDVDVPAAISMILDNLQHVKSEVINSDKYISKLISSLPIETMRALNVVDDVLVKCKDGSPLIKIPEGVVAVGNSAFKNCEKLETIVIGDDVKSLGNESFRGCKNLTALNLPVNVKHVGESSFRDCISLKELVHGHIPELAVQGEFQEGAQVIPGPGKAPGALLVVAEGIPHGILGEPVVGIQSLHLHRQVGKQRLTAADGFPHIHVDFMAEIQMIGIGIVGGGAVIQQQGRIHGDPVTEHLCHGHRAAGIHCESAAVVNKIPDGLQIPLRNGRIRRRQGAVIVNSQ